MVYSNVFCVGRDRFGWDPLVYSDVYCVGEDRFGWEPLRSTVMLTV